MTCHTSFAYQPTSPSTPGRSKPKSVFWDAQVSDGARTVPVTFYNTTRLLQDLQAEVAPDYAVTITRLIVVDSLTIEQMTAAVATLPDGFCT
ncbi:hypothetical protein L1785_09205 [Antribacter sp. KLBMP9083]|uniref:Uncharacterized protein n=1 Tax=Antribacter soli TaxID=2910976 RepID=A0AA41QCY9_9MICO|nr:hypothetical protein [Antribacter soli]MCF4121159.1 hypothetical protein [Antribacter soli]